MNPTKKYIRIGREGEEARSGSSALSVLDSLCPIDLMSLRFLLQVGGFSPVGILGRVRLGFHPFGDFVGPLDELLEIERRFEIAAPQRHRVEEFVPFRLDQGLALLDARRVVVTATEERRRAGILKRGRTHEYSSRIPVSARLVGKMSQIEVRTVVRTEGQTKRVARVANSKRDRQFTSRASASVISARFSPAEILGLSLDSNDSFPLGLDASLECLVFPDHLVDSGDRIAQILANLLLLAQKRRLHQIAVLLENVQLHALSQKSTARFPRRGHLREGRGNMQMRFR